ncbi:KUP system potassium uptake protein [Verrucomicrobium sp. GAS474]|uniref:potassium transporter Kup n=1 Tax=Verrucomicrobium sp. GAS474 TaxID=1882831 RepID=UPI00087C70BE|nr:KUP/HAK/KT family potassium transporter [Verrucomicrobium sp. GAS474]SDT85831.1 KUP system potassium uptake protein [Verrucomicrobium sp. GAS474]
MSHSAPAAPALGTDLTQSPHGSNGNGKAKAHWPIVLAAVGVVYGDIGTSPLYALNECLINTPGSRAVAALGCASLIFWSLIFVVTIKYVLFVSRADNQGEGGIFALLALRPKSETLLCAPILFILAGASLLYGDGLITPAISVLSAAEGLKSVNPIFTPWVLPLACTILFALFWFQKKGTAKIGGIFGPVMVLWFATLAVLGAIQIVQTPAILHALNPLSGLALLKSHPVAFVGILGSVVLAVTGAEALYADMGHFGRPAIARGWYGIALPGLALNYLGQAAYVVRHPDDLTNPFTAIGPQGHYGILLVLLSLAATIIACQALITGTFSLTRQAISLGYFPRLGVIHTSAEHEGHIYLPFLNWMLGLGSICLVLGFKSSGALAAAYGIAVTGTMAATSLAFYRTTRYRWEWPRVAAVPLCVTFLLVDLTFFGANLPKFQEGGWLPLLIGGFILTIMVTWKRGRAEILRHILKQDIDVSLIVSEIEQENIHRVAGCAVFMSAVPKGTPIALLHHLKANRCLHKTVLLLTLSVEGVPRIPKEESVHVEDLGGGLWRVIARYGYMDTPNGPTLLAQLAAHGIEINPRATTYFFNRETIIPGGKARMWPWQKELYRVLSQNARPARDYFGIPPNQIIEMGLPVQL